MTFRIKSIPWF